MYGMILMKWVFWFIQVKKSQIHQNFKKVEKRLKIYMIVKKKRFCEF